MFFQDVRLIQVAAVAVTYELPNHGVLDNLTIWVVGPPPTNAITVQPTVNGVAYGAPVVLPGGATDLSVIVFQSSTAAAGRRLIPANWGATARPATSPPNRPFVFGLSLVAGVAVETLTVYAAAEDLSST